MDLVMFDDDDRPYVPWWVAAIAVVLVGLLAVGLTVVVTGGSDAGDRSAESVSGTSSAADDAPTPSTAAFVDEPCSLALDRADAAIELSSRLEQALAEQTVVMDDLLAQRATAQQAVDRSLPRLIDGASDRSRFADEVAAYRAAREGCPAG